MFTRASSNEYGREKVGGADRDRTCDPHNAIVVLYQLSYDPNRAAKLRAAGLFVKNLPDQARTAPQTCSAE